MTNNIAFFNQRPMAFLGLATMLFLAAGIQATNYGPMYPSPCPSAQPYSDTPACLAKQKCEAPKIICCPASGKCPSSTTASASSTSTAASASSASTAPPASSSSSSSSASSASSASYASPSSESSSAASQASESSSSPASQAFESSPAASESSIAYESSSAASEASSSAASESSSASYNSSSGSSAASSSVASTVSVPSGGSTASTPGNNEPCPCELINYLLIFKFTLTISEQAIFEQYCLAQLRIILIDVTLTIEQKIVLCGRVIRSFCSSYSSIGDRLKFVEIGDYGYCYDFAFVVCIAYEDDMAEEVCDRIDNSGATNFTVAISNGTSQNQCGADSASHYGQFVSECNQVMKRTTPRMNRARQLSWIYDSLEYIYFAQYPSEEECVKNITISAGDYSGSVGSFLDLCQFYNIETQIISSVLADNSSTGECPFISSCERGVQSANSSGQYNSSVVEEAQRFVANCSAQFASQSNGNSRLQIVLNLFVNLSQECRLLLKQIQVSGASIACLVADVVSIGNCCENGFACQNITYGGPGENLDETCIVDTFNISSIVVASQRWLDSLNTSGQRSAYRSYHNSIVNCCYSSQYGSNVSARVECAKGYVSTYSGNNVSLRSLYYSVQLTTVIIVKVVSQVISAAYGTLGCFCSCTSC